MPKREVFIYLGAGIFSVGVMAALLSGGRGGDEQSNRLPQDLSSDRDLVVLDGSFDSEIEQYFETIRESDDDRRRLRAAFSTDYATGPGNELPVYAEDDLPLSAFVAAGEAKSPAAEDNGRRVVALANLGNSIPAVKADEAEQLDVPVILEKDMPALKNVEMLNLGEKKDTILGNGTKKELPATTEVKAKTKSGSTYTVKSGDTLWKIANHHKMSLSHLLKLNPEYKGKFIHPGDKILLSKSAPPAKSKSKFYQSKGKVKKKVYYRVKSGDTLSKIARRYKTSVSRLKKYNGLKNSLIIVGQRLMVRVYYKDKKPAQPKLPKADDNYRLVKKRLFTWPVKGRITSFYGYRRDPFNRRKKQFHAGIDISAGMNKPVQSVGNGIVIYANRRGGYGNTIIVRHPHGYLSFYAHLARMNVEKGDIVKKSQVIGLAGRTGNVTAAHLHFEMKRWLKPVNPVPLFDKMMVLKIPKEQLSQSTKDDSKKTI